MLEELSCFSLDLVVSLNNITHVQLCSCCGWSRLRSECSSSGWRGVKWEGWNCDRVGLTPDSTLANICQIRLRSDCGAVCVCVYYCSCSMMGDTVRNMPSLAFGIPTNNIVKISV